MGIAPITMLPNKQYELLLSVLCTLVVANPQSKEPDDTQSLYDVVEDNNSHPTDSKELTNPTTVATCDQIMANNGLNFSSFWHGAAHGIHSIYLEEIREYFESNATIHNKIPVVNPDLSAEQTILFDSPLAGYDEDFNTMALKVMAYFMLHDKPDFATQGLNTLEKLTHQYHMHEIYKAAAPIYNRMKNNPPHDPELCPCVNDVTGNGILLEMVNIAQQLKYFNSMRRSRNALASRAYQSRKYRRVKKRSTDEDVTAEDVAMYEQMYLTESNKENAEKLLKVQ